ncbi:polygalacturonase-like [Trifolium pratense]|uniref:polygalacturonase-like n=1 Tax=Trifolium pratense TaxID=57577 RepID=UPI001E69173F|nr:polygalacturonase-like [Trifolium pratense]
MNSQLSITTIALLLLLLLLASNVTAQPGVFNIRKYGAPNGDITNALKSAWKDACASSSPSKVVVPSGWYKLQQIDLEGPCNAPIEVRVHGKILAPKNPYHLNGQDQWVRFQYINFFTLSGRGTFDGQGEMAWTQNDCGRNTNCNRHAMNFGFAFLNNSIIQDINSKDSKYFHANVFGCNNVTFRNFNINAPETSPNTDGIHIGRSTKVQIINSKIGTGDDCISLGDGSRQITIRNVTCGPGHGISVGSLGRYPNEEPVVDLTVKNCTLNNTDNGVRIKTWPGTSVVSIASHLHFEDIIMVNVTNPIIIDQEYCPWNQCSKKSPSQIKIRKVLFKNIRGTSATQEGVALVCSRGVPCEAIVLSDIDLSFNGSKAIAKCANVKPTIRRKAPICMVPHV